MATPEKQCSKCKRILPTTDFKINSFYRTLKSGERKKYFGQDNHCLECCREDCREWQKRHKEEVNFRRRAKYASGGNLVIRARNKSWRKKNLKHYRKLVAAAAARYRKKHPRMWLRQYKLTPEKFDKLLDSQNGLCALCGVVKHSMDKPLHIDHDHKTEEIRGLLCSKCNHLIGVMESWPDLVPRVQGYICNPPARAVLSS